MKDKYNYTKIFGGFLILLSIAIIGCEEDYPVEAEVGILPVIESASVTFDKLERRFLFQATVEDPQGISNIDSVYYTATWENPALPVFSGTLNDLGVGGDIIITDGTYSSSVMTALVDSQLKVLSFVVGAVDLDGNSAIPFDTLTNFTNFPPELSLVYADTAITAGDTISIEVKVIDPEGLSDIKSVTYIARKANGTLITGSPVPMRDDGLFGDIFAGDGVYSVKQATGVTLDPGVITFFITAKDFAENVSDTLEVPVRIKP